MAHQPIPQRSPVTVQRTIAGRMATVVIVSIVAVLLAACTTTSTRPQRDISLDFIGNVYPNGIGPNAVESELWTQLTPENAGKWGSVESIRDVMNWAPLDEAYEYAQRRGVPFRFHTLVWGQQQPSWLASLSQDEQLEELTEWMTLVAERYPEIDFIDVVNEPVHETPVYAAALGGRGETGIDWVVTVFTMARELFPNAALHVNDYNILTDRSDIDPYLDIISILQERQLVDGIGLQAHSLERATISAVEGKLDRLARTGLPLYITELDVALENDVRQAEQFSALVALFAEHPAVRGVTLWGSVEARLWQEHAYLIRRDGSYRPALEWLLAYLDGEAYEIPEYEPVARVGTNTALRIDAESFDVEEGVEAAGSVIAYVDGGDYVGFEQVQLRVEYTAVRVRYAKGSPGSSRANIVLLRPDGFEAASIELASTGDWNAFTEVEVEFAPIDGVYDLFVVFEGGEGVGNIDYIEFVQPGANALLPFADPERADESPLVELQAELADELVGVEVADDIIAYLDDSDYILFRDVDFGAGASRLLLRYAKDSIARAGVELRLDSDQADPLITFQLGPTGGWDTFALVETEIPTVSGVHDLYVTFRLANTTGVGNFDWFRFFPGEAER